MSTWKDEAFKLEQLIKSHLKQGNRQLAIKGLLSLIILFARKQDFRRAEALQAKIIVIDPTALSEVVEAQEIIDNARTVPVNENHRKIWAELYERLTSAEADALNQELKVIKFKPGMTIFAQGQKSSNLCFIDAGQAKHLFSQGDREMFIKRISAGNVANEEPFFGAGLCTSTLVAVDHVKVSFLPSSVLPIWSSKFPALESKLRDFCGKEEKIHDLLAKNNQDRRIQQRISLPGRVLIKVVTAAGTVVGKTIRGDIGDVSVGGVSFFVHTTNREQAQMLLGHNLHLRFNIPPDMTPIEQIGQVLAVKQHSIAFEAREQYSVHVKFSKKLAEKTILEGNRFIKMMKITESKRT